MPAIVFAFNEKKAIAAGAVILREYGGAMPYLSLVKLLYVAERESLRRRGRPIFGDEYFSMKDGPVVSTVLDRIRHQRTRQTPQDAWSTHITTQRYNTRLTQEPDLSCLSEAEVAILREVADVFKTMDKWQVRDWTHRLPEYQKPPGNTARRIVTETLLRKLGKTEKQIAEIREDAVRHSHFDSVFGS